MSICTEFLLQSVPDTGYTIFLINETFMFMEMEGSCCFNNIRCLFPDTVHRFQWREAYVFISNLNCADGRFSFDDVASCQLNFRRGLLEGSLAIHFRVVSNNAGAQRASDAINEPTLRFTVGIPGKKGRPRFSSAIVPPGKGTDVSRVAAISSIRLSNSELPEFSAGSVSSSTRSPVESAAHSRAEMFLLNESCREIFIFPGNFLRGE